MRSLMTIALGSIVLAACGAASAEPCDSWSGGDPRLLVNHAPSAIAERFRRDSAAYFGAASSSDSRIGGSTLISVTRSGTRWYFVFDHDSYAVMRKTLIYDEASPGQEGQIQDGDAMLRACGSDVRRH